MEVAQEKKTKKVLKKKTSLKVVDAKSGASSVLSTDPVGMIGAEQMRDNARNAYGQFQKSWYEFAKVVANISNKDIWTTLGYDSFKQYCLDEFRDIGYGTIIKFIHVVNSWGDAIEDRLKKNPLHSLPSYETCYTLTTSEEMFPKSEVPKLRKQILDGKVTVKDMRERVSEIKGESNKKEEKDFSRKIEKDIERAAPLDMKTVKSNGVDDVIDILESKIDFLIENIPLFTTSVKEPSEKLVNFATKIQDVLMNEILNDFLDKVSDIEGEE